jgi:predicted permease
MTVRDPRPGPGPAAGRDDEIEFHLEMRTKRYVEAGLDPAEARAKAVARLGDIEAARTASHAIALDMGGSVTRTAWWPSLLQDARFAVRVLRGAPLFTITSLLTIGIGIGAATAVFSVVNAVLLRQLPYPAAPRLVVVWDSYQYAGLDHTAVSPEEFADLLAGAHAFDRMTAARPQATTLTGACSAGAGCEPERLNTYVVSPDLFEMLGVSPGLGRSFTRSDGGTGAARVVLLSDALWRRRFGADPTIVGRSIALGGLTFEVIGVMPAGIRFPDEPIGYLKQPADAWIPRSWETVKDGRGNQYLAVLARLRSGASLDDARANLAVVAADFRVRFPDRYATPQAPWRLAALSLRDEMFGDVRPALLLVFGAVGCVLLIACANVANLTVARGTRRRREMAVRSALGAGRGRLVQQLMIETLLLTGVGAGLGVLVAEAGLRGALALNPGNIAGLDGARIDAVVLTFTAALAIVTGVIVGLVPALGQSQADPQSAMADGARGVGATAPRLHVRASLVVAEVALAVVVLIGAGLLIRSFVEMTRVPMGFSADRTMTAGLALPRAVYTPADKAIAFQRALLSRLSALPGVTHTSAVYPLPMSNDGWSGSIVIDGRDDLPGQPPAHAEYAVAHPHYFETMRIPVIEGREFAATDAAGAPSVGIVDVEFAKQYWPGKSAIGQRVSPFGEPGVGPWTTIIGVVGHVRNAGARAKGEGQFYFSALQKAEFGMTFVVRTTSGRLVLAPAIRSAVRELDPNLPIASLEPMDQVVVRFTARERFNVAVLTIFGIVALTLAAVGLYGVLASLVSQRVREIGIRLALGARPAQVVRRVVAEGLGLAALGLVLGLASAAALSRAVETLLHAVAPVDPVTYGLIAAMIMAVSLVAAYWPARAVMAVDLIAVLRA